MRTLPIAGRLYVLSTVGVAAAVLAMLVGNDVEWRVTAVLICLYGFFEIVSLARVDRRVSFSLAFPVGLASVILLHPAEAALVSGAGMALGSIPREAPAIKRLFNIAVCVIAAFAAGVAYDLLGGKAVLTPGDFPALMLPVALAALIFCLVNAVLLAGVLYVTERVQPTAFWRSSLSRSVGSYLGYGTFGLMFAVLWSSSFGPFAAVLVLLPLLVARWAFAQYAREKEAHDATVRALVHAVEIKDGYTRGHSERVSRAAVMIARRIGMRDDRVASVGYAGLLHDVGKLSVPTRLLQKSGPLTDEEYQLIQMHPVRGVEIIQDIRFLREVYKGVLHHHERVDGRGYPLGLVGEEIPEFARLLAVADAFDTMTTDRAYRRARPVPEAVAELLDNIGGQFDGRMVDALVAALADEPWTPGPAMRRALPAPVEVDIDDFDTLRLTPEQTAATRAAVAAGTGGDGVRTEVAVGRGGGREGGG